MTAWNDVLQCLKHARAREHQQEDHAALPRVGKAEHSTEQGEGDEPFDIGRRGRDRAELDRRKSEHSDSYEEQPRGATKDQRGHSGSCKGLAGKRKAAPLARVSRTSRKSPL